MMTFTRYQDVLWSRYSHEHARTLRQQVTFTYAVGDMAVVEFHGGFIMVPFHQLSSLATANNSSTLPISTAV